MTLMLLLALLECYTSMVHYITVDIKSSQQIKLALASIVMQICAGLQHLLVVRFFSSKQTVGGLAD